MRRPVCEWGTDSRTLNQLILTPGLIAQRFPSAKFAMVESNSGTASPVRRSSSCSGRLGPWLGPLVVFVLSGLVFEIEFAEIVTLPPAWRTFEFCQYAEIGKNLATEGVYNTRVVEPMVLAMIDRDEVGDENSRVGGRWSTAPPCRACVIAGLDAALSGRPIYVAAWSNGLAVSLLASAPLPDGSSRGSGRRWAVCRGPGIWLVNSSFYGEFVLAGHARRLVRHDLLRRADRLGTISPRLKAISRRGRADSLAPGRLRWETLARSELPGPVQRLGVSWPIQVY